MDTIDLRSSACLVILLLISTLCISPAVISLEPKSGIRGQDVPGVSVEYECSTKTDPWFRLTNKSAVNVELSTWSTYITAEQLANRDGVSTITVLPNTRIPTLRVQIETDLPNGLISRTVFGGGGATTFVAPKDQILFRVPGKYFTKNSIAILEFKFQGEFGDESRSFTKYQNRIVIDGNLFREQRTRPCDFEDKGANDK